MVSPAPDADADANNVGYGATTTNTLIAGSAVRAFAQSTGVCLPLHGQSRTIRGFLSLSPSGQHYLPEIEGELGGRGLQEVPLDEVDAATEDAGDGLGVLDAGNDDLGPRCVDAGNEVR